MSDSIGWENVGVSELRLGYGIRHPDLDAVLQTLTRATSQLAKWGELRLRTSAYLTERRVPDPLVTSVRCLVEVDGHVVVTESPDDVNVWPGGGVRPEKRCGRPQYARFRRRQAASSS